ncbi:MAG: hypothetical protein RL007_367 [Bacteroidota bacterium]|jgi:ubiquinone/menaquinone biosynthesis C-methylase UbiE
MNHAEYFADSFNRHVKWYEESITPLSIYNESYNALIERMRTDANILDVGCGPANVSSYIKTHLPETAVTGIDLAPEMISKAKEKIPEGDFRVMDIRNVSQLEELFDVIVLGFCIPYLNDKEIITLLNDCRQLTRFGGYIYLSYIVADSTTPFNAENPVMRRHNRATIATYLTQAGLNNEIEFTSSYTDSKGNTETHIALLINLKNQLQSDNK